MKPLQRATIDHHGRTTDELIHEIQLMHKQVLGSECDWTQAKFLFESLKQDKVWINDQYQVMVRDCGDVVHLSIKRIDKAPIRDWRDFQEIKNQLVGRENEGFELYPAESRIVDTANQYHLWVFKDPTIRIPVGFDEGRVISNESGYGAVQRPREETL